MHRVLAWMLFTLMLPPGIAHASTILAGQTLPALSVMDWSGRPVALAAPREQIAVIDFWASWCPSCRAALPALDAIARRHPGLTVLAINIDKNQASADRFLAERLPSTAMTVLRDPDGAVFARFGAEGMPAVYVLDRNGVVRLTKAGYAPDDLGQVEATIDDLLRANPK